MQYCDVFANLFYNRSNGYHPTGVIGREIVRQIRK